MAMEKFARLEEGIDRLLSGYEALRGVNAGLKEELLSKTREVDALKERLASLEAEKGGVRERVDGLLERLEGLIQNA